MSLWSTIYCSVLIKRHGQLELTGQKRVGTRTEKPLVHQKWEVGTYMKMGAYLG